jgi:non-lysosomal glucosylceramidase
MKNKILLLAGISILFLLSLKAQTVSSGIAMTNKNTVSFYVDSIHTYKGDYVTGIDFPVGALGGSVIRMNGKAEREWWHIFNNFEERAGSGVVPNSFFAIRTKNRTSTLVRSLQTSSAGQFAAMNSLMFQGEYPFGWYDFVDDELPVKVSLEAYSFLIPMDLKNSAIPCAVFTIKVKNNSSGNVQVSLLAAQQNAVGFTGYDTIAGPNNRNCRGYGSNLNTIVSEPGRTSLKMAGNAGSMQFSAYESGMTYNASWESLVSLFSDFSADGQLSGNMQAGSPHAGTTVDGALAKDFTLNPGQEKTITFVLSWYFPKGSFGRKDIPVWNFPEGGNQYENWWTDAGDVDNYVFTHFKDLDAITRLYHNTLYSSNIPRNVLDRISSNICVLKSPTAFWTKNGYFGLWESTSSKEEWFGNCKHVYHYAQGQARLFPELGRILRNQDLKTQTAEGLLPARDGQLNNAMDGHFGSILGVYREHLLSGNNDFLSAAWIQTKKAMDYAISTFDIDKDGMMSGTHHNTLDCNISGTSPWIGSLYMAALKASEKMAGIMGDAVSANAYNKIWTAGVLNQNSQLWDSNLGYYKEKTENLPDTKVMGNAVAIDMLLGQWWANQLGLGQIYPEDRTRASLLKIYSTNKFTDTGSGYVASFRDFLGTGDTGWQMFRHPAEVPENTILYYNEVMSGFEYAAAATMLQYGMINEGTSMVNSIANRYDGRLRAAGEVHMANNSTVFGCGSPFGEDECGDFYGRALSSWSVLLALQGFVYDGPKQTIGFKPVWQPENHKSFFTASSGWGLFTQTQNSEAQTSQITVKYGSVLVKKIILSIPVDKEVNNISVQINGNKLPVSSFKHSENTITVYLKKTCNINNGSDFIVSFQLKKNHN